jgi:hypothetical protein
MTIAQTKSLLAHCQRDIIKAQQRLLACEAITEFCRENKVQKVEFFRHDDGGWLCIDLDVYTHIKLLDDALTQESWARMHCLLNGKIEYVDIDEPQFSKEGFKVILKKVYKKLCKEDFV